jgi:hypothetical protein
MLENLHRSDFDFEPTKENLPKEPNNDSSPQDQSLAPLETTEPSTSLLAMTKWGRLDTFKFYDHIRKQRVLVMVDLSSTLTFLIETC